jgi:hypothetical protein
VFYLRWCQWSRSGFQLGHIFNSKKNSGATSSIPFLFEGQFQGSVCNVKAVISNKSQF